MRTILIFFLGASLGSFIGLWYSRYPHQSILKPPSHCDKCQIPLKIIQKIPILSYFIYRKRCPICQTVIPKIYFFLEVLFASLHVLLFNHPIPLIFSLLSISLSLFDFKFQSFPFSLWLFGTLILSFLTHLNPVFYIFLSLAGLSSIFDLKIGNGDFLFLATLSLIFNFHDCLFIIELASFLGIAYIMGFKKNSSIPFIPFLVIAACIVICSKKVLLP